MRWEPVVRRPHALAATTCPICGIEANGIAKIVERNKLPTPVRVDCKCCGLFILTEEASEDICVLDLDDIVWTGISYRLRRMTDRDEAPVLTFDLISRLRDDASIPTPDVLLDELILWLGTHTKYPGHTIDVTYPEFKGVLGAVNVEAYRYMTNWIDRSPFFEGRQIKTLTEPRPIKDCQLTPQGWIRFRELTRTRAESRFGFVAMKYGDLELDGMVRSHFAEAARDAGFELRRLDDQQPAGLIDDQMRTLIRTARFLVCDLSHGNNGAYWEAGFAEGLGKPVIYTCRKDVFDDPRKKPHFDTNHLVTIIWDPADPHDATNRFKATLRATLPSDAILED